VICLYRQVTISDNISPFITTSPYQIILVLEAQRLVAQALGRIRVVVSILTGKLKPQSNVFSLSIDQIA
jgi:hypothetical protein